MPVIFAELAAQYPPKKVREPGSGSVAANGQYMLVKTSVYKKVGGHRAVASEVLEDVALARRFKQLGGRVFFRYGGDAVRTRMYRNWPQLREGWTKNLALLFPHPARRALLLGAWWMVAWLTLPLVFPALFLYWRIRRAHFSERSTAVAMAFGPPAFVYLLLRSARAHAHSGIIWKGRTYKAAA